MAYNDEPYAHEGYGNVGEKITSNDTWTMISSSLEPVPLKLDPFDEFISSTMLELMEEQGPAVLDQTTSVRQRCSRLQVSCGHQCHIWGLSTSHARCRTRLLGGRPSAQLEIC